MLYVKLELGIALTAALTSATLIMYKPWIALLLPESDIFLITLAYTVVMVGLLIPCLEITNGCRTAALALGRFIAGGLVTFLLVYLPYVISGNTALFLVSIFKVPLSYSAEGMDFLETAVAQARNMIPRDMYVDFGTGTWLQNMIGGDLVFRFFFWFGGTLGLLKLCLSTLDSAREYRQRIIILLAYTVSVLLSILGSGHRWGHYLIQVAPFVAIGAAQLFPSRPRCKTSMAIASTIVVALLFSGMLQLEIVDRYRELAERRRSGMDLREGDSFIVADYLMKNGIEGYTLFSMDNALVYRLTGKKPLTPISSFPSNITKEAQIIKPLYGDGATAVGEVEKIFRQHPDYVLVSKKSYSRGRGELLELVAPEVRENYFLEAHSGDYLLFRRR